MKNIHPLNWIAELLEDHSTFARKRMFGGEALYLHGRLVLMLSAGDEPWNGLLVCTFFDDQPSLIRELPELASHPVLGKWLYISQAHPDFESTVESISRLILRNDPRIGIEPKIKKRRKKPKK